MKIRPYREGDAPDILDLDARVLPSPWNPRNLANWHWKFTGANPAGHALIQVGEHEGRLVAHFAAVRGWKKGLLSDGGVGGFIA